jgi:hypothetical protein
MVAVFAAHVPWITAWTAQVTSTYVSFVQMATISRRTNAQPVQLRKNGERKPI